MEHIEILMLLPELFHVYYFKNLVLDASDAVFPAEMIFTYYILVIILALFFIFEYSIPYEKSIIFK